MKDKLTTYTEYGATQRWIDLVSSMLPKGSDGAVELVRLSVERDKVPSRDRLTTYAEQEQTEAWIDAAVCLCPKGSDATQELRRLYYERSNIKDYLKETDELV